MNEASKPQRCGKCGAALSGYAPDGLCAACLLECAFEAQDGVGTVRAEPAASPKPTLKVTIPEEEAPGALIGRYKLLEKVGEGGFGVVYVAEQREPVKRRVALKIIKLGMDTRQVVARFEAERQALAMMDHPNIAKVFDAGATEAGRPFFVMELVRGIRITEYCDQNNLSTRERLDLFIKICHAIQHAHQKGIIHRDIKPSNILITVNDGVPVPKVIDFGIAKATQGELTDKTVYTQLQQFIGTPAYMSPEQAEMTSLDVDTRSDIYALGVLLYELLTGRTPFNQKDLLNAGLDGMRRMIREQEPPRPSTRVSTLQDEERTTTAKRHGVDGPKLIHLLRGDLDWIAMKCLEKDRTRRYDTANGLAMDIRRHLENEPVVACPPSAAYRFQKLVRRNKLVVAAVSAVAAALLIGLGLSTWLWLQARKARDSAVESRQKAIEAEALVAQVLKEFIDGQITRRSLPREHKEVWMEQTNRIPNLVPPGDARLNGKTYEQWAAAWWQWCLEMPLTNSAGAIHPSYDESSPFDVTESQTGDVWFLGGPFLASPSAGTIRRSCQIPTGKALFFPLFNVECSSIEAPPFYGKTAEDQAGLAQYWADHIVSPFCELDGIPLSNLEAYRVQSPQITINVPAPWILGKRGGKGTSSGDGYFVFLAPLPPGRHTLRFGGALSFTKARDNFDFRAAIDMTYHITVVK